MRKVPKVNLAEPSHRHRDAERARDGPKPTTGASDRGCRWSELVRQIGYKAEWAGRTHIDVDRWFPSTKRCSACHEIREGLTLADRRWQCEACGATHDRDLNAAKNLAQEGLRLLDEQRPGGARLLRVEGDTSGTVPAR